MKRSDGAVYETVDKQALEIIVGVYRLQTSSVTSMQHLADSTFGGHDRTVTKAG